MHVYLETSVVLSWLLGEPLAEEARSVMSRATTTVTSTLTLLQAERALLRYQTNVRGKEAKQKHISGVLKRAAASWITMEISRPVRERASRPFPKEPLRSLDAIHLATALEFSEAYPGLVVLSFDHRIIDNLAGLGLAGING